MRLVLMRHGETLINTTGLTHYTNDVVSLNPLGRQQAKQLIPVCKQYSVQILYTSPEPRAKDTATIIANGLTIPIEIIEAFRERKWGKWEGKPWAKIEAALATMQINQRYQFVPPDGESWEQVELRIQKGMDHILQQNYETVGIVTHGGILRTIVPIMRKTDRQSSFGYEFKNGSVTIFETKEGTQNEEKDFREILINDTTHLHS